MVQRIAHRGPDGDGTFFDVHWRVGLAHRRLSIIDLSVTGNQPMRADRPDGGSVVIVYNGEIYNFQSLRQSLEQDGYSFVGTSDTEVLLKLYLRHGAGILGLLNGIFAFAIWDAREGSMFLARDGLGVKPLYYAQTSRAFYFSSELKSLLEIPELPRRIDQDTVIHHLTYLWSPAPGTMLESIRKLEPGSAMIVRNGRVVRKWRFYELPYRPKASEMSAEAACERAVELVEQAVRRQMVSDVPVGAFLSGGLDSSAIVYFARHSAPERELQCFTMRFRGGDIAAEGFAADLPYARRVARELGVQLHEIEVGPELFADLASMVYHLDEPQADLAPLNALAICHLARAHGIKVLLSGAGGDDIFGGYRRHFALMQERWWGWLPVNVRSMLSCAARMMPANSASGRRLQRAFGFAALPPDARIEAYFRWASPKQILSLLSPELAEHKQHSPLLDAMKRLPKGTSRLDQMLFLDGKYFLADHNLNYTDKMGMAAGVEVRVPLLDLELVEFAASLPDHFKQHGRTSKWLFKHAMARHLPREVVFRPKTGFGVPLREWLRGPLANEVELALEKGTVRRRGLFDFEGISKLRRADAEGRVDASYVILALTCIEVWCQVFLDGRTANVREAA